MGIYTDDLGAKAARDHMSREFGCRDFPERKQRLEADRLQLSFTVIPDIAQEQVAIDSLCQLHTVDDNQPSNCP